MKPDPSKTLVIGEWYIGASCPVCGEFAAHMHDPSQGTFNVVFKSDSPGASKMEVTCLSGHKSYVPPEQLHAAELLPIGVKRPRH
jgi:hypothetical protein